LTTKKSACSRFDKFNHVKYTKTLSVRNRHTAFFVPFDGNNSDIDALLSFQRPRSRFPASSLANADEAYSLNQLDSSV